MSQRIEFWQPRFVGRRFQEHTIPLVILKDLAVLEELVMETAKWKFLTENPKRLRIPKGFLNSVSLTIAEIKPGSSVPTLSVQFYNDGDLFPPDVVRYFDQAKTAIIESIQQASEGIRSNYALPDFLLQFFDRLGRSLQENEYIDFEPLSTAKPARLTGETRKCLVLAAQSSQGYSEEVSVRGSIPEADQQRGTFTLRTLDGKRLEAPFSEHYKQDVFDTFNRYNKGAKVLVHGIWVLNRSGVPQRFEQIDYVAPLDELDVPTRLEELSFLRDGWLDGSGKGFALSTLKPLATLFEEAYPETLPLPHLYPTDEGNLQAEWDTGLFSVTLEIDPENYQGEYQALNKKTDEVTDRTFKIDETSGWTELVALLGKHLGGA